MVLSRKPSERTSTWLVQNEGLPRSVLGSPLTPCCHFTRSDFNAARLLVFPERGRPGCLPLRNRVCLDVGQ
jgi:hypothetical protein